MNHRKEKHGLPACDRFRVVLKVKEPMPKDKVRYQEIMERIAVDLGADEACKDYSRYYRGNGDAEIWTNTDGGYFDWTFYDKPKKEDKKTVVVDKTDGEIINGLTDDNLFTHAGDELLRAGDICGGNRDNALATTVGILIQTVKNGNISHQNAITWLDNKLREIMTPDFKGNAQKYMRRLEKLEF